MSEGKWLLRRCHSQVRGGVGGVEGKLPLRLSTLAVKLRNVGCILQNSFRTAFSVSTNTLITAMELTKRSK